MQRLNLIAQHVNAAPVAAARVGSKIPAVEVRRRRVAVVLCCYFCRLDDCLFSY